MKNFDVSEFEAWLRKQAKRDDLIGDLAIDCARVGGFPKSAKTKKNLHTYLMFQGACSEAHIALNEAVDEFMVKQKKRKNIGSKIRFLVFKRDGYRCKICGLSSSNGTTLHVDHIYPVSKGGGDEMSNLQTLCLQCNPGKRADLM